MDPKVLKNLSYLNRFAQKLRDYRLNKYAKEVRTPLYKQSVIKNKKVYNRKKIKNEFDT
mgnify:FL=1